MTAEPLEYDLFVRGQPDDVWQILTDNRKTPSYQHFNMTSEGEWVAGGEYAFLMGDRRVIVGEVLDATSPSRLAMTFHARWTADVAADAPSQVVWELSKAGPDACRIKLTHTGFKPGGATRAQVQNGWPETLSRLKTLVETGETLDVVADYAPQQN